eukprot:CAMPEP_0177795142 /NCGR_PEP_ID=MMETSP0491_2-20121128/26057_1 /TAXON_ID=63592 /ORGANISM="Tetraselmis chuii, Strain PLY429" /LENGTH=36 /DNA_ID= /DNA_START= /DNA_END= /DNA_ORIENTATION=
MADAVKVGYHLDSHVVFGLENGLEREPHAVRGKLLT